MKNTEAANWIENWLDNVGERGYQSAFISALFKAGFTIIHNTSHNSLELGKDVIAKSPKGEWFAFQLKGNPAGRFTMSQWQLHMPQLLQLCRLPIRDIVGSTIIRKFAPVLVTNGEVEEDVQAALELFNSEPSNRSASSSPLRVWNRGTLLKLFTEGAELIWPHDTKTQIDLLRGFVRDFRDETDMVEFQGLVDSILGHSWEKISKSNALSRIISSYIATNLYASIYVDNLNLYESIRIKIFFYVRAISYAQQLKLMGSEFTRIQQLMCHSIMAEINTFAQMVCDRFEQAPLLNDDFFAEYPVYHVRRLLVQALCAISLLENGETAGEKVRVRALEDVNYPCFSHEAVVPAFLAVFWAKENYRGDRRNDLELVNLLRTLIAVAKSDTGYGPYHTYCEVLERRHKEFLGIQFHELDLENPRNYSYFSLPVFYMVARRNWKRTCKTYWPDITEILNNNYIWENYRAFSSFRSDDGYNNSFFVKYPSSWADVTASIPKELASVVPDTISRDHLIFIIFLIFFPFRANLDVILYIDRKITDAWYYTNGPLI